MTKLIASVSFLLLSFQAIPCMAESCDAGHGCTITCTDGCSAVYNEDTGGCSTGCGEAVSAAHHEKGKHIDATFRDMPKASIDRLLNSAK